jgi:uncharacterized membrane protein YdjX (TVP38/TMEM64 family)
MGGSRSTRTRGLKKIIIRIAILAGIVGVLVAVYSFTPLKEWINPARLFENRDNLIETVKDHLLLSALVFIGAYIVVVALSIPGATILTILGGFFFGPIVGTLFVNAGATIGAFLIFLAARYFLGEAIQEKYRDKLARFNKEIEENGKNYMLTLRLIPIFPFFLINLLSGFTIIPAVTFLWTTALGIIPGSFVYSYIGFAGANLDSGGVFQPAVLMAFLLLALLSVVPVIVKKVRASRGVQKSDE